MPDAATRLLADLVAIPSVNPMGRDVAGPTYFEAGMTAYLVDWLGLVNVATLESKPGVEPSGAQLAQVAAALAKTPARMIVRAAYHDARPANWLADKSGLPVAVIPFSVGGSDAAKDLVGLYDDTIRRLLAAAGAK